MKKTTKILSEEHKNILKAIESIEEELESMQSTAEINRPFFKSAIKFIKNYADKFHHSKEEYILFKEIDKCSKNNPDMHCNPVEQMIFEHNIGRGFVKGMGLALKQGDRQKLVENTGGYIGLLREHIFKEDNILYRMADEILPDKIQKSMLLRFNGIEKDRHEDKIKCLAFVKGLRSK